MAILCLDIGGTAIKAAIETQPGVLARLAEDPTEARLGAADLLRRLRERVAREAHGLEAIGISTTGYVDGESGRIAFASDNLPGWTGVDLARELAAVTPLPIAVENDVYAHAVGEAVYGAGRRHRRFVLLTYGTGIGGAIVEDGAIQRGSGGFAGACGHLVTHAGGRACSCGLRGCYEAYASARALTDAAREIPELEGMDGRALEAALMRGSEAARRVTDAWLEEVLAGLVGLIHSLSPTVLVLGGGIMNNPYHLDYLRRMLPERVMPIFRGVQLERAELGNRAGLLGAAVLARRLLDRTSS